MRLWHERLLPVLPKQWMLGQHRECCALRGGGWGRKHATVDYVFTHPRLWLVEYHWRVIDFLEAKHGVTVGDEWHAPGYRGKVTPADDCVFPSTVLSPDQIDGYVYPEHNDRYLTTCIENLRHKGKVDIRIAGDLIIITERLKSWGVPPEEKTMSEPRVDSEVTASCMSLLARIRTTIKDMTDDLRLEFFSAVTEGYCRHCGRDDSDSPRGCQCWNDE